jgi:hypothetical protein
VWQTISAFDTLVSGKDFTVSATTGYVNAATNVYSAMRLLVDGEPYGISQAVLVGQGNMSLLENVSRFGR